jgi:hypothetical protein
MMALRLRDVHVQVETSPNHRLQITAGLNHKAFVGQQPAIFTPKRKRKRVSDPDGLDIDGNEIHEFGGNMCLSSTHRSQA